MKVKTVIEMDYNELEDMVNKHYNLNPGKYGNDGYSFVETQECGNDCAFTFYIPKAEPLNNYSQKKINELMAGQKPMYCNHDILQDLVNNGQLAPGEYLIKVCW